MKFKVWVFYPFFAIATLLGFFAVVVRRLVERTPQNAQDAWVDLLERYLGPLDFN